MCYEQLLVFTKASRCNLTPPPPPLIGGQINFIKDHPLLGLHYEHGSGCNKVKKNVIFLP